MPIAKNWIRGEQAIFEHVATHLLTQKVKCMVPHSEDPRELQCAYRGKDGMACAAGCLIPDDCYNDVIENIIWWGGGVQAGGYVTDLLGAPFNTYENDLIKDLQNVHDMEDPSTWWNELIQVAINHKLDAGFMTQYETI